ncbi:hypothetical protein BaRGS_00027857, partial [Batillaria attramentaria]
LKSLEEVTLKADLYRDANPGKSFARKAGAEVWTAGAAVDVEKTQPQAETKQGVRGEGRWKHRRGNNQVQVSPQLDRNQCRLCKQQGHWAKKCPNKKPQAQQPQPSLVGLCIPMSSCHQCGE